MIQVCSLGGGVASTALFLMSLHGEIESPADAAIFADTGAERQSTLDTIQMLKKYAKDFEVPVHIVKNESLPGVMENALNPDSKIGDMPFFAYDENGKVKMLRKYCTKEFKTKPAWKVIRSEFGATYKTPVSVWLGYTTDEASRMKQSKPKYEIRRFPLIEKRLYRQHCQEWLDRHGFETVERSACVCCPFRRNDEYQAMPEHEIQKAIDFEESVNKARGIITTRGENVQSELRLHPSMIPLSQRPFDNDDQTDLFDEMCDGGSCFT